MDRYFCTVEITYPKKGYFSYPSAKTFPFHSRNKNIRGISDPIKTEATEQVINYEHAQLDHYPKKESQPVKAESAKNGNQMASNGPNPSVDIPPLAPVYK